MGERTNEPRWKGTAVEKRARELWEDAEIRRLSSPWTSPTRFEGAVREHYLRAARLEEKRHG